MENGGWKDRWPLSPEVKNHLWRMVVGKTSGRTWMRYDAVGITHIYQDINDMKWTQGGHPRMKQELRINIRDMTDLVATTGLYMQESLFLTYYAT
ncbi:hypothetical protein MRB53_004021 [Persea americana]|uniref:Uncharacterized protein n=1 Tax=Persea americana TaxID=3435 RepID=A0ACC2MZX6_PERAE|nr:hypothetical protein MRB53_004021 [Persea americana]